MSEITILNPRAENAVPVLPYELSANIGVPGLRLALVSNSFFDASKLLGFMGEALSGRMQRLQIRLYEIPNASVMASPQVIAGIAAENDVAITALGHCGSCTSSATRDAVHLAQAGIPVCALISEKFWEASGFVARSVGMPDIPRIRLPHPVAGTGSLRIKAIAEAAAPQVLAAWQGRHVLAA